MILMLLAPPAAAQNAAPAGKPPPAPAKPAAAPPAPAKPAAAPPAPKDDDYETDGDDESTAAASVPPEAGAAPAPIPPPAPPRSDEQLPAPYLRRPAPPGRVRHVDVGLTGGISHRPAEGAGTSYSPGPAYGVYARIEAATWLGVRAYVLKSEHAVTIPRGDLGLGDAEISQPDLDVTLLAIRAEPTWVVTPRIRLWAGIGIGWAFFSANEATISGGAPVRTADRHGVALEPSAGLGGSYDLVKSWLSVSLLTSASLVTNQSGDAFATAQGLNASSSVVYIGGLPEFASAYSALIAVGALL